MGSANWHDLLYAVARDNECENFIERISEDQSLLKKFAFEARRPRVRGTFTTAFCG